jgi:hypothetical protein
MCDICNAAGYEIGDGCEKCGASGGVGVYLDGSGCWECAARPEGDSEAVLQAFAAAATRRGGRPGSPRAG